MDDRCLNQEKQSKTSSSRSMVCTTAEGMLAYSESVRSQALDVGNFAKNSELDDKNTNSLALPCRDKGQYDNEEVGGKYDPKIYLRDVALELLTLHRANIEKSKASVTFVGKDESGKEKRANDIAQIAKIIVDLETLD